MTTSEKVAYLKGLAEGMGVEDVVNAYQSAYERYLSR